MLAQSTLRLRPPDGYGQAARLLRGPVDPKLSPPASDTPPPDEVTVRTVEDVTRGLGLSDASADRVQALADSGAAPFGMGQSIRGVLAGDNLPAALVLEITRRATRYAKTKRASQPRPVVGTVAALALRKSCDDDAAPVIGPPPANNRAVHPFVGTVRFHGLPLIRLENLKGSTRSGADADGNAWSVTMPAHYGEFARSEGADGDPVDVFVGPNRHAPRAYVVHLQNPVTGEHDEDKVMVGFQTADDARACFAAAYNRNDLKMGPVRTLTVSELAEWLAERENRGQKIEAGRLLAKSSDTTPPTCGCGTKMSACRCKRTAAHDGWACPGCGAHGGIEAAKRTPADLRDAVEKSGGAPASQTYGTPANMPTPKAAEPPPAPPPVAKPHHHAEPLQLPTRPTKKFPPPSHPKPTKAPMKLMSTPPEMMKAQRHEADALLKAAGGGDAPPKGPSRYTPKPGQSWREFTTEHMSAAMKEAGGHGPAMALMGAAWKAHKAATAKPEGDDATRPTPKQTPAASKKSDPAALTKNHEHMQKLHTKAADEAADRGDGALSKLHADAAGAHTAAAHAHGAGLGEAAALTKKAADATRATLPQEPEKPAAKPQAPAPASSVGGTDKPASASPASGVGGRSKEGLKVIAIGPKGGKIVGYTTKDGKQKAIYEGSAGASKLAATVATHAPEPAKPEAAAPEEKTPAADAKPEPPSAAAPATDAPATDAAPGDAPPAEQGAAATEGQAAAPSGQDDAAGAAPAEPDAPTEPIDDKPLSPDEPPGGTPTDAPSPDDLGSASPKTDSPEARHAEEIAKLRGQVEDAHKKLEALAHHIDTSLVPMYNNLKGQARAAHRNPSPSVVGWLLAQIGRFAAFVLGLHEDKGKVTATQAMNGEANDKPGNSQPERNARSAGANGEALRDGATAAEKKAHAEGKAHAEKSKPKPPQARVIEKSITATGRPLSKASPADLEAACVRVLVTLQAVERLHHAAHLQAKGPESYSDHLLFQRLYAGVQAEIDGLSEKMVAAFGEYTVDADARAADVAETLNAWLSLGGGPLAIGLSAELELQRVIADALGQDPSPGLENFLQGLADAHETPVYLLQQRLSPAVEKSMRETTSRQAHAADALLKSAASLR